MKKLYAGLAVIGTSAFFSGANAQDYDAQIDALQNELLKIKQEIGSPITDHHYILATIDILMPIYITLQREVWD